jgi:hypothetical protein
MNTSVHANITTGSFNLFVKDRNRMFRGNRETFFPPKRCVFNPPEPALRQIRASSKFVKAIASPKALSTH